MMGMDELYRRVEQEYAFRRLRAAEEQRRREEEIRRLSPAFAQADEERAGLSFARAQAPIENCSCKHRGGMIE